MKRKDASLLKQQCHNGSAWAGEVNAGVSNLGG